MAAFEKRKHFCHFVTKSIKSIVLGMKIIYFFKIWQHFVFI